MLFTRARLHVTELLRRINICMTLVCVPDLRTLVGCFPSSSQVTSIRWKGLIFMQCKRSYLYIFKLFSTPQAPPRFQHSHGNLTPATLRHKKVTSALSSRVLFCFEYKKAYSNRKLLKNTMSADICGRVAKHCCLHDTDLDNLQMLIDDKKVVKLRL